MLQSLASSSSKTAATTRVGLLSAVSEISSKQLSPLVAQIDTDGLYPEAVMRALGAAGAYAPHTPANGDGVDIGLAVDAMAIAGEYCLSTSFCVWCQDALGWYIYNSENETLKADLGPKVANGTALGGTALSNPMKTLFGIERMRLKGKRVAGGYVVNGLLPFVSNLGSDHYFGGIFEVENPARNVMAIIPCNSEGLKLADNTQFTALDGTRTFAVQMRDVFISDDYLIADPIDEYIKKIRAGFVLLQAGMAFGLIRDCVALMRQVQGSLGHVNKYLEQQPDAIAENLAAMEAKVAELAAIPYETSNDYWRTVIQTRLAAGEASVAAAHAAMLHCGARGYVKNAPAQRRLREAYFVAIVTPATKQLRKMLADMSN